MTHAHDGFLFPFGIDEELLKNVKGFLSRWTITSEYSPGYTCFDKYYRRPCYFQKRNGSSIIVYDWKGQLEPYELARLAATIFSTKTIKKSPLIEIFPNRWDAPRIRVLCDGETPVEVYFTADGKTITPAEKLDETIHPTPSLPDGFKVYRTLDARKPYRIVHENGQYFIVKNGYVYSHIPFGGRTTLDRIQELLLP